MNNIIHKMNNEKLILLHLAKNQHKIFTMHELSKILKIPYATFYRTINKLKNNIKKEKIGNTTTIKINKKAETLEPNLILASIQEKEEYLKNNPEINLIQKKINPKIPVILFGSYAKNTQTKNSDIDLIVLNQKISFSQEALLLNKEINPLFFTEKEYKEMLKQKEENVAKQALKNHIILSNPKKIWEATINGIQ